MPNKIDIVDFAENILGVKLRLYQKIILRRLQEAEENDETLVINAPPGVGKTMIKNIMKEYEERNF